jgi:hypothetical protein
MSANINLIGTNHKKLQMNKRTLHLFGFVLVIFSAAFFSSCSEEKAAVVASAQPANLSYHEEFDSMQRVIDAGWKGVNLSNPLGEASWQQGSYIVNATKGGPFVSSIASHSYKASANEHAFVPYTAGAGLSFINCWLISPALSMKNGDKISFWTTTSPSIAYPDRMQVWLNPIMKAQMLEEAMPKPVTLPLSLLTSIQICLSVHTQQDILQHGQNLNLLSQVCQMGQYPKNIV